MLQLRIALRYLFSRKTHSAVNVISLISVGGVAVATMAIVIVLSVFNGFHRLTERQMSLLEPSLRIIPTVGKMIAGADSLAASVNSRNPQAHAVPTLSEQAFAVMGDRQYPVTILGVSDQWIACNSIADAIIDGEPALEADGMPCAVMSVGAAVTFQAYPADPRWLRVYVPKRFGKINPASPMTAFRADSLVVSGVVQTSQSNHADDLVILPIDVVRGILDYDTEATSIELWTDLRPEQLQLDLPDGLRIVTREEYNAGAFAMIAVEKWITFAMLAFILVIASFNIVSTLCLLVLEKRGNISIMQSMGATASAVSGVFVIEGWLISLTGGVVGIALGVMLTLAQQYGGFIKLGGDHSQMVTGVYPVQLQPLDLLAVLALVAVTGLLTSIVTAIFARRHARGAQAA